MAFLITFTEMKCLQAIYGACILSLCFLTACEEKKQGGSKPIHLGDPAGIVTETDSVYLKNFTDDISPKQVQSSESEITDMMVEVDSAKASAALETEAETNEAPAVLSGLTVSFSGGTIILNGIEAHTLNRKDPDPNANSVSYVHDAGDWKEMKLAVNGMNDVRVEQRLMTRLAVNYNDESVLVSSLGRFTSPWYNLPGNGKQFVSLGTNSITYMAVDGAKIKQAAQSDINAKKWSADKKRAAIKTLQPIRSFRDKPCTVLVTTIQWRISAIQAGKKVQKLVQLDLPNG